MSFICRTPVKRELMGTPKSAVKKRKTSTTMDPIESEILRQLKETSSTASTDDEDLMFGQSVSMALKRLTPQKKSYSKV